MEAPRRGSSRLIIVNVHGRSEEEMREKRVGKEAGEIDGEETKAPLIQKRGQSRGKIAQAYDNQARPERQHC